MTHYHGLPITPSTAAAHAISGGHAFVSHAHPDQLALAVNLCQSFAVDNGAFSAWRSGSPIVDWSAYYAWADDCSRYPGCDFAVIPDSIDGDEEENDSLLAAWPLSRFFGAPVWHMSEPLDRLSRLVSEWPRVCLGSSGDYLSIGTRAWWERMDAAMGVACDDDGRPRAKLHGLRMLDVEVFTRIPLSSADSTNIGRNIGLDGRWTGSYTPPTKELRAHAIRVRIESANAPERWAGMPELPRQEAFL